MEFKATQKFILVSPRKLREVTYLLKKITPAQAVDELPFVKKNAARLLRKVIMTAIGNAKQKNTNVEDLEFKEIQINEGPRLKRYRAGARGRAKPYQRKMSHIRVILKVKEDKKGKPENKALEMSMSEKSNIKNQISSKQSNKVKREKKS